MAISQSKYVEITSGVGGEATASRREFIGRIYSTNALTPTASVLEFSSLDNVGSYYGTSSAEYIFAGKYFGFVSKNAEQANKISFARYVSADVAPTLRSTITFSGVGSFTSITDGSMVLSMGGTTSTLSALDFSAATSLSDVATTLQDAIRAAQAENTLWSQATVAFTDGAFLLTGGETGNAAISYATAASSGTDISSLVGWSLATSAIVSEGADAETPAECLARTAQISNNFGSFAFIDELTADQKAAIATWNAARNYGFLYSTPVDSSNYADIQAALNGYSGCCITLDKYDADAEFMPMSILATTPYNSGRSAVKNYMYQQFDSETPSVTTDSEADTMDALKINYLGATQQAGSTIAFYQDGYCQDGTDIGVYCNEMWLKDAIATEFMNLLVGLEQLPANDNGRSLCRGAIQGIIDEALVNGVIMSGKELTSTQRAYITSLTSDSDAWREVQTNGYYLTVSIDTVTENSVTKYIASYLLVYSKGDSIRKVEGSDILI